MVKKGLIMTLVVYFFVIQAFIIWAIWQDSHFYTLGCINLLFFVLFFFGINAFKWEKGDKWENKQSSNYPIVKERIAQEIVEEKVDVPSEEVVEEKTTESDKTKRFVGERTISESNIEYIKTKINRAKRKPLREGSAVYRFLVFLLAILWLGGILYAFWDSLDFIALTIGSFAMLIFIGVCFKAGNLRRKSLFSSIYFLLFCLAMLLWIYGMIFTNATSTEKLKDSISTFFDGVKWETVIIDEEESTGDVSQSSGTVISFSLTGNSVFSSWDNLTGEELTWTVFPETKDDEPINLQPSEPEQVSQSNKTTEVQPVVEQKQEPKVEEKVETKSNTSSDQVTIIEAIKHLVKAYNIPLSKSTSSKFTHVSKSSSLYPYMKTALEKKMIWTTTDPNMIVSCEVYMVMKGLAEWWGIAKSADLKDNYWNVAESKGLLNWCTKWAKLTYANL